MEAVIKVGGSLVEKPESLRCLCQRLSVLSRRHKMLIVPGGNGFADEVRRAEKIFSLSSNITHWMAILGMDQFGFLLSSITPFSQTTYSLKGAKKILREGMLPIFLPSRLMFREDPLEHSWDVTSDSIAAYIAVKVHAKKLILITDVDGIFSSDPKNDPNAKLIESLSASELIMWDRRTSVDKFLPKILLKAQLDCYVVNGLYPERIEDILKDRTTICTRIKGL